jgi:hypothetical protein
MRLSNRPHVAKDTLSNFHFSPSCGLCGSHGLHDHFPDERYDRYLDPYRGLKCKSSNRSQEADRRNIKNQNSGSHAHSPEETGLIGPLQAGSLFYIELRTVERLPRLTWRSFQILFDDPSVHVTFAMRWCSEQRQLLLL